MSTTTPGLLRWSQSSGPERFEAMTVWSIYAVFALEPLMALLLVGGAAAPTGASPFVYLAAVCLHALVAGWTFVPAMRAYSGRGTLPWRRAGAAIAVTAVVWAVAVLGYPGAGSPAVAIAVLLPGFGLVGVLTPMVRTLWAVVVLAAATTAAVWGALALAGADRQTLIGAGIGGLLALLGGALSFRLSVWTMRVVWELDDARAAAGRLAVAEERLRFSRDLHDVFGRTLATVAVKSELAAALAERGDPRGAEEMLEVRRLAHDALREVRGVVQGYRTADLDTEIAGARELLRSAGVECRVAGEGLELPEPVAEAAAWVVREAVTNVVRHAAATRCDIEVRVQHGVCRVRVVNDGVAGPVDVESGGNGLRGLRERLGARRGSLAVEVAGTTFAVEATLPVTREDAP